MWITDLTVSIIMFSAAAVVAFTILMNSFSTGSDFSEIRKEAVMISDYLMSEGTPSAWDATNVVRPGFMTGSRVNSTKVYTGMNLTNSSYHTLKSIMQLNEKHDFIAVFINSSGSIVAFGDFCSFGKPWTAIDYDISPALECHRVNFTGISYSNLARITRYAVLGSGIAKLSVYVWD